MSQWVGGVATAQGHQVALVCTIQVNILWQKVYKYNVATDTVPTLLGKPGILSFTFPGLENTCHLHTKNNKMQEF